MLYFIFSLKKKQQCPNSQFPSLKDDMMQPFRTTTVNVKFMQSSIKCICSQFAIHYKVISDLSFFISKTEPPSMSNIHNLNNPAQELCNLPLFPRSLNQAKITDHQLYLVI